MNLRLIILIFTFIIGGALPASAHPHIFARYNVTIAPGETGFINLHFTFTFQGVANPLLSPGAPMDKVQLEKDMLANLTQHPFFVYLDMDGQSIGQQMVRPAPVKGEKDLYAFDLAVPNSVQNFGFALYDPTYFDSVWQADAQSLTVKLDTITCSIQDEEVGKTVWGMLRAQYVQCAGKNGPKPPPHISKKLPMDQPPDSAPRAPSDFTGRQIVP